MYRVMVRVRNYYLSILLGDPRNYWTTWGHFETEAQALDEAYRLRSDGVYTKARVILDEEFTEFCTKHQVY